MKRFSIFLPVHNGGEHIKQCVASVLAQTIADFDLIILENGSTDGTAEWLKSLTDPRITVLPSEALLPIEENWSRILTIPKNEFMTIIGHDDLLDPDFLDIIQQLVERHPEAGLYLTHFRLIDTDGRFIRHCLPIPERQSAAEYLAARLCVLQHSYGTGHVMRSADYDAAGGIPLFKKLLFSDDALFIQLIGDSYRATAQEEAFSYRAYGNSVGGGCSYADLMLALVSYADFLADFSQMKSSLLVCLERYFSDFVRQLGRKYLRDLIYSTCSWATFRGAHSDVERLAARFEKHDDFNPGSTSPTPRIDRAAHSAIIFILTRWLLRFQRKSAQIRLPSVI